MNWDDLGYVFKFLEVVFDKIERNLQEKVTDLNKSEDSATFFVENDWRRVRRICL